VRVRSFAVVVLVALAAALPFASQAAPASEHSILVGTVARSYRLYVPASYDPSNATSLVIMFHGLGGTSSTIEAVTGWDSIADKSGIIVAYPDSLGALNGWNCKFISSKYTSDADDELFFLSLVAQLRATYKIDPSRIFVAGFSNGAFLAYELAGEHADMIAAIAVVGGTDGTELTSAPRPSEPISVIAIHGMKDDVVPYSNGWCTSAPDDASIWANYDSCTGPPTTQDTSDGNTTIIDYQAGKNGTEVKLYAVHKAPHTWPAEVTEYIWQFFAEHAKDHTSTGTTSL
jgi:polyhydroxybutyrate depolymerase